MNDKELNELIKIRDNMPEDATHFDGHFCYKFTLDGVMRLSSYVEWDATSIWDFGNIRSLSDIDAIIKLEQQKIDQQGVLRVIRAVAHIGVDFGYGKYKLEQEYIDMARAICEQEDID